jgi:TolB protein
MAIVAGGLIVGSSLLRATATIPQGGEALIAFGTVDDSPDGLKAGDIYTVRADGTELRQLTDGPEWEADPSWSPDGTRMAFRSWVDGTDSIVVMDADGGNRVTLASSQQSSQDCLKVSSLAWAPDGSSLVFPTRAGCVGPFDLQIVATDGTRGPMPLLTESFDSRNAAWSPDGTAIAVVARGDEPTAGLRIIDTGPKQTLDGPTRGRRIGPDLGSDVDALTLAPRWSPDGSELAVGSVEILGSTGSIHVMAADGSGSPLTIEDAWNPAWSPDGSRIAFQRQVEPAEYFDNRPCTVRTWVADADGSNERMLDELGDGCEVGPVWSPDGTRLLGLWIDTDPANPDEYPFYLSVVTVDGSQPPVHLPDSLGASWQPVVP